MQDADQAGIALVDLGSARQQPQSCSWAALDDKHFQRHPGLTVLQMAWHPGNPLFEDWPSLAQTSTACSSDIIGLAESCVKAILPHEISNA